MCLFVLNEFPARFLAGSIADLPGALELQVLPATRCPRAALKPATHQLQRQRNGKPGGAGERVSFSRLTDRAGKPRYELLSHIPFFRSCSLSAIVAVMGRGNKEPGQMDLKKGFIYYYLNSGYSNTTTTTGKQSEMGRPTFQHL